VPYATALMDRVEALARECDRLGLFDADEVLMSAGGSAIFDLVATRLTPALGRPVRGLLRSGCYITHDHGHYRRLVSGRVAPGLRPGGRPAAGAGGVDHMCSPAPSRAWRC
jgi:D-serine deaminase-like pyridoxal phosphate-dependent protein